jgi:uncharacterized membrane protein
MEYSQPRGEFSPARVVSFLSRRWLFLLTLALGLYVWLPFLAPVLMRLGLEEAGRVVYLIYSFLCHQLPERSFFLFGPQNMYSLAEIQAVWANSNHPLVLRQFIGSPEMGWKVAWSDRMVFMFTSLWLALLALRPVFLRLPRLPWWALALFLLPMFVDGMTHFVSDLSGIGLGFRSSNLWLESLTSGVFGPQFYAGDAFGSFNSWMRLVTGLLFGVGFVWFGAPYLAGSLDEPHLDTMEKA